MSFYDNYQSRKSSTTLGSFLVKRANLNLVKKIKKYVKKRNNVSLLEIGGGKGEFAGQAARERWKYISVEANEQLASQLKKYGKVYINKVPPINIKENNFDVVFSSNVIEHIDVNNVYMLISDIRRKLSRDGILVLKTPNYMDMGKFFWDCDYTHVNPFTLRRLQQLLIDSEYKIVDVDLSRAGFTGSLQVLILIINKILKVMHNIYGSRNERMYKLLLTTSQQITIFAKIDK